MSSKTATRGWLFFLNSDAVLLIVAIFFVLLIIAVLLVLLIVTILLILLILLVLTILIHDSPSFHSIEFGHDKTACFAAPYTYC